MNLFDAITSCQPNISRILGTANTGEGRFVALLACLGLSRSLSRKDDFAALSRSRHKRFKGLPLDQRLIDADSQGAMTVSPDSPALGSRVTTIPMLASMALPIAEAA